MAFLIFRCGVCGEAVRTVDRPQYRRNQEVITPLKCEDCKDGRVDPIEIQHTNNDEWLVTTS